MLLDKAAVHPICYLNAGGTNCGAVRFKFRISNHMKRRSARPFTVEIKHTRTSRTSLTDATARSRRGQDLWGNLPVAATDKPAEVQSAPAAHSEPARSEAPARRVLPSLVPTFAMPVKPESPKVRETAVAERLPRVRRVKLAVQREQQPVTGVVAARPASAEPMVHPQVTSAIATSRPASASAVSTQPASPQPRTARRIQQAVTLRPGERWKRRLPRMLW